MSAAETLDVAGVLVRARPAALARLSSRIAKLPGADVHAVDPGGKLVVTLEASSSDLPRRLDQIRAIGGVLSVSLVYEHTGAIDGCGNATPRGDA